MLQGGDDEAAGKVRCLVVLPLEKVKCHHSSYLPLRQQALEAALSLALKDDTVCLYLDGQSGDDLRLEFGRLSVGHRSERLDRSVLGLRVERGGMTGAMPESLAILR